MHGRLLRCFSKVHSGNYSQTSLVESRFRSCAFTVSYYFAASCSSCQRRTDRLRRTVNWNRDDQPDLAFPVGKVGETSQRPTAAPVDSYNLCCHYHQRWIAVIIFTSTCSDQEVGQGPMVGVPGRWVIARLSLVLEPSEVSPWIPHYIRRMIGRVSSVPPRAGFSIITRGTWI